jgi:hypothetical protein
LRGETKSNSIERKRLISLKGIEELRDTIENRTLGLKAVKKMENCLYLFLVKNEKKIMFLQIALLE